jgi:hypothetical protein
VGRILFYLGAIYSFSPQRGQMMACCEAAVNIWQPQQTPQAGDGEMLVLIGAVCSHNGNPALARRAFNTALRFFQSLNQPRDVKVVQEQLARLGKTPLYRLQHREFTIRLAKQPVYKFSVSPDGQVRWSNFVGKSQATPVGSGFPWDTVCTNVQATQPTGPVDNLGRISQALSALLQRDNPDAFVIFEEKSSRKFVQFAGSAHEELLLDLPAETLTAAEMERATLLFQELGMPGPETYPVYTDPSMTEVAGMQTSFNMRFGRDFKRAAQVALAIFRRVYGFPADFQLTLKEN